MREEVKDLTAAWPTISFVGCPQCCNPKNWWFLCWHLRGCPPDIRPYRTKYQRREKMCLAMTFELVLHRASSQSFESWCWNMVRCVSKMIPHYRHPNCISNMTIPCDVNWGMQCLTKQLALYPMAPCFRAVESENPLFFGKT